jgi:hypothetical protein
MSNYIDLVICLIVSDVDNLSINTIGKLRPRMWDTISLS